MQCKKCELYKKRDQIVLGRGSIPSDILYMGEAPGTSENALGEAFVGMSGELLDIMMNDALVKSKRKLMPTYYIINTVLCMPQALTGEKRQPKAKEVLACMENVTGIIEKVNPKVFVLIGNIAERFYKSVYPNYKQIVHPAALLRGGGTQDPRYKRNVRILVEIFNSLT